MEDGEQYEGHIAGVSLEFYLIGKSNNIDLGVVKMLAAFYPAIYANDDGIDDHDPGWTPLHLLLMNQNISDLNEITQYLFETEPT